MKLKELMDNVNCMQQCESNYAESILKILEELDSSVVSESIEVRKMMCEVKSSLTQDIKIIDEKFESLKMFISTLRSDSRTDIEILNSRIVELEEYLTSTNVQIREIYSSISSISNVEKKIDTIKASFSSLETYRSEITQKFTSVREEFSKQTQLISRHESEISNIVTNIKSLNVEIKQLSTTIQNTVKISSNYVSINQTSSLIDQKISIFQSKLTKIIQELEINISNTFMSKIEEFRSEEYSDIRVTNITQEITQVKQQLSSVEISINSLKNININEKFERVISDFSSKITSITNKLVVIQQHSIEISQQSSRIKALEQSYSEIEQKYISLERKVESTNDRFSSFCHVAESEKSKMTSVITMIKSALQMFDEAMTQLVSFIPIQCPPKTDATVSNTNVGSACSLSNKNNKK